MLVQRSYWTVEPEEFNAHPFIGLLDAIASDDILRSRALLNAIDHGSSLDRPAQPLPAMTPPLIQAVWQGNTDLVDMLLQRDARADVFDVGFGGSPVHWAAAAGRDSVLERLLSQFGCAAANVRSNEGFTPLHIAAGHGRLACVKVLLRHSADPNAEDGRQSVPLHEAAEWGHRDIAKALIDAAARVNAHNRFGESPLLLAARGGFSDVVEELLQAGADLERSNKAGVTPLLCAAFFGHTPTVKLLSTRGANPLAVDSARKRNAVQWAAFNDHLEVVEDLVKSQRQGPSISSIMQAATEGGADSVLEYLRSS